MCGSMSGMRPVSAFGWMCEYECMWEYEWVGGCKGGSMRGGGGGVVLG